MNARNFHPKLIAKMQPSCIQNNTCFLVDLDELPQPKDLLLDDLGSWNHSETAIKKYLLAWNDGLVMKVPEHSKDGHSVFRRTFINKRDNSLRKTIVKVVLPDSQHHDLIFVSYYFKGVPEHRIQLNTHGNAKTGSVPYIRTYSSTLTNTKDTVSRNKAGLRVIYQTYCNTTLYTKCFSPLYVPF